MHPRASARCRPQVHHLLWQAPDQAPDSDIRQTVEIFPNDSRNELSKTIRKHANWTAPKGDVASPPAFVTWSNCSPAAS